MSMYAIEPWYRNAGYHDISRSSHQFNRVAGPKQLGSDCKHCVGIMSGSWGLGLTLTLTLTLFQIYFRLRGEIVQLMTCADIGQRFHLSSPVVGTQKHGRSLRNHVANIYTSWDLHISICTFGYWWPSLISVTPTTESIYTSPTGP